MLTLSALTLLALTGCAGQAGDDTAPGTTKVQNDVRVSEAHTRLQDGRTVVCLHWTGTSSMSCDWAGAK